MTWAPFHRIACVVAFLIFCSSASCLADGKVYVNFEEVPPSIPYQRALILQQDGYQTMVLQSQYTAETKGGKIGWIIPLPAEPEISSMSAERGSELFELLARTTAPQTVYLSKYILPLLFLLSILAFFYAMSCPILWVISAFTKEKYPIASIKFFGFALLLSTCAIFSAPSCGAKNTKASDGVSILSEKETGIYQIKVIKATSPENLTTWLTANNFKYTESDISVFEAHISDDWCFATVTVKPEEEWASTGVKEGLFAPIVFRFPTEKPVYPLALTGTAGHPTTVLLYLISNQFYSSNDRIKIRHASKESTEATTSLLRETDYFQITRDEESTKADSKPKTNVVNVRRADPIFRREISELTHLMKFKSELSADEMSTDLIFEPTPKQKTFTETLWRW